MSIFFFRGIDIFAGGLTETSTPKNSLIASQSYHHDQIVWCLLKRPVPMWSSFFYFANDWKLWSIYFITNICLHCFAFSIQVFESKKWDWNRCLLYGLGSYFAASVRYEPKNTANRLFISLFLLSCILHDTVLIARLMQWMSKIIYQQQLFSLDDIIRNEYDVGGDGFILSIMLERNQIYPPALIERFAICNDSESCLNQLKSGRSMAVAFSREYIKTISPAIISDIYCFEPNHSIYEYNLYFLVEKKFKYLNELNEFILRASRGGFIEKWSSHEKFKFHSQSFIRPITLEKLSSLFLVCFPLVCLALSVLMLERIIHERSRNRNVQRIWRWADIIIKPDRHFLLYDFSYNY